MCGQGINKKYHRRSRGSVIAELPMVLWILFMVICFPMLNLATAFFRVSFLYAGVHFASISAARSASYLAPVDGKPSAVNEAVAKLNLLKNSFAGLDVQNIKTEIVVTNNDTLAMSNYNAPLAKPADQSVNSYQIQVSATCSGQPLVVVPSPFSIAGVNAPLVFNLQAKQYCENPQGLNL
jgi:hypothetical protein